MGVRSQGESADVICPELPTRPSGRLHVLSRPPTEDDTVDSVDIAK